MLLLRLSLRDPLSRCDPLSCVCFHSVASFLAVSLPLVTRLETQLFSLLATHSRCPLSGLRDRQRPRSLLYTQSEGWEDSGSPLSTSPRVPRPSPPVCSCSVSRFGLYKIFFYLEAFAHESTILSFPAPTCIAHPGAILLHDYWAIYDSPRPPFCMPYTIHYW